MYIPYFSDPEIEVGKSMTEIRNIGYHDLEHDMQRLYGTSTIGTYMMRRLSSRKIIIDNFFLVELSFLITKLLQLKNIRSNRKTLSILLRKINNETWVKDTHRTNVIQPNFAKLTQLFKLKPFDQQKDFLTKYLNVKDNFHLKGLLLHGKAGSGKTFTSVMWNAVLPDGILVNIVPQHIINSVWEKTYTSPKYWKGKPPKIWLSTYGVPPYKDADIFIIHYEFLLNPLCKQYLELIKRYNGNRPAFKLCVDEIHNFNDLKAKRTQALIELADTFQFTDSLPMSGTPFKAQGKESYTAFALIDAMFQGGVRKRFLDVYGRSRDKLNEVLANRIGMSKFTINSLQSIGEAPDIDIINVEVPNPEQYTLKYIRQQMITYIQERVKYYDINMNRFLEYYNEVIEDYRHAISDSPKELEELKEYLRIVNRFRTEGYNNFTDSELSQYCKSVEFKIEQQMPPRDRKYFRSVKSVVKYVGLKIRGEALGNVLGKARINAVKALVAYSGLPELINSVEKKTLIFTDYVDVLTETVDYLTNHGFDPVTVYGDNSSERDKNIKLFEQNPKLNPLVTTFKMLKEGYPLIMANQIIMMNPPWRQYIVEQTKARIHREGQTAQTFFRLTQLDTGNEENITSRSVDILQWSAEQVEQILGTAFGTRDDLVGITGVELYQDIMVEGVLETLPPRTASIFDLL